MIMLTFPGGMERTEAEYGALFEQSGIPSANGDELEVFGVRDRGKTCVTSIPHV